MMTRGDDGIPTDRVAIVTGGSRGLGREVTHTLARRGYPVVVSYARNQQAADTAVEEVLAARGSALAIRADVADQLDVERLFAETTEAFGGVDVLVLAAGRLVLGPVADLDRDQLDAQERVDGLGASVVNREAARQLRDGGSIVNLCGAVVGLAPPVAAAHSAHVAAVEAITHDLAAELRDRDITVNAVVAGPLGAVRAAAIAELVACLVSSDARHLSGQVIRVEIAAGATSLPGARA